MAGSSPDDAVWRLNQQLLMAQEATRAAEDAAFQERLRVRDLEHALQLESQAREAAEARALEARSIVEEATRKAKEDGASTYEGERPVQSREAHWGRR